MFKCMYAYKISNNIYMYVHMYVREEMGRLTSVEKWTVNASNLIALYHFIYYKLRIVFQCSGP